MNETVRKWLQKAELDYSSAVKELKSEKPNHDLVCFLSQQCIEKLLKGLLILHQKTFPKSHDLVILAKLLSPCMNE